MDYDNMTLVQMATELQSLREQHEGLKRQAADVWAKVDRLRMDLIPKKMEEMSIETTTITGVGRISVREEMSVKTEDKMGLFNWMRQHEHEDMISDTINSSTLKAFIREQIGAGQPIPDSEIITIKTYEVATITKR